MQADYRLDGKEELICCSVDGEVRGFLPPTPSLSHQGEEVSSDILQELSEKKAVSTCTCTEVENTQHIYNKGHSHSPRSIALA